MNYFNYYYFMQRNVAVVLAFQCFLSTCIKEESHHHLIPMESPASSSILPLPSSVCPVVVVGSAATIITTENIYTPDPSADWRFFARLPDGRALVSCHARNAVLIVNANSGEIIGRLECEFAKPEGIAVNSKGSVFVVDRFHHCIHVFNSELIKQPRCIASDCQEPGRMNQPVGIAISSVDDSIWIADNENHRVLQFSADGRYVKTLGSGYGTAPGQMFCPCGIALYNHPSYGELVAVSEWGGGRVQVFFGGGEGVFSIYGGVQHAHHVVVDSSGILYVTEYATRKIKRYSLDGELVGGGEWSASVVSLAVAAAAAAPSSSSSSSWGLDTVVVLQKELVRPLVVKNVVGVFDVGQNKNNKKRKEEDQSQ